MKALNEMTRTELYCAGNEVLKRLPILDAHDRKGRITTKEYAEALIEIGLLLHPIGQELDRRTAEDYVREGWAVRLADGSIRTVPQVEGIEGLLLFTPTPPPQIPA